MKQFLLIFSWLCIFLGTLEAQTNVWPVGFEQRIHVDAAGQHKYFVYVPNDEPPTGGWPIMLFLHGAGERGSDGVAEIAVGLGTALEAKPRPFVAVFPQCQERGQQYRAGWINKTKDAQRALEILADVERSENVNSHKRILCGWSMGGYGAWSNAAAQPEMWSAVLAISGGLIEPVDLKQLATSNVPLWAIHGADDAIVPATETQRACRKLREQSGRVRETIVKGTGHDVWRYVFAEEKVFQWLMDPTPDAVPEVSTSITPLPSKSRFYVKNYSQKVHVPHALGMRLGNQVLGELAGKAPSLLNDQLQGELPDINRTIGGGASTVKIQLRGLEWKCQLADCQLQAISGGRFLADFAFAPIELKIGSGQLENAENLASCSDARIVIGHQRHVHLRVEVRPKMREGRLTLDPLRTSFSIKDDNWFVDPPRDVQVQRGTLKPEHIKIGIVGGLYLQKEAITAQVLQAIPALLTQAEEFLQSRPAPALTKVIWPFPVGGPEIVVSPESVGTDRNGVSLTLGASVVRYGNQRVEIPAVGSGCEVRLQDLSHESGGEVLACLDLTNACSKVQQDHAWVNVLDIPSLVSGSEYPFSSLVAPEFVRHTFGQEQAVQAILRVLQPMSVRQTDDDQQIQLCVPEVALDYFTTDDVAGLGCRVVFSLKHDIRFQLQESGDVRVTWSDHPEIELIETRPLDGLVKLDVDQAQVLERLRACWLEWTQAQSQSFHAPEFPGTKMKLRDLHFEKHAARLRFGVSN